jgi:thiol-disulfide isomerase/thioredoxin
MSNGAPVRSLPTGAEKIAWYNSAVSLALYSGQVGIPAALARLSGEYLAKHNNLSTDLESEPCTLLHFDSHASSTESIICALLKKTWGVYTPSALTPPKSENSKFARVLIFLFFFALTAALSSPTYSQEAAPTAPDSGPVIRFVRNPDHAPDFKVDDLDGKPLSLSGSRGKVILLNFWATWCGPCRAEIPDLIELQKKYGDRLQIIGLDVDDDDSAEVKKFVEKNGINYPVGIATNEIRVQYGGVAALPTSFVLDDQGRVVQKHEGLRNPLLYEFEIRSLIGLPIPARVETFEDTGEIFLKHADRASTLPGVDMSKLTPEQRTVALHRFNAEGCTCGCQFTLAQCRIYDRNCPISKARTTKIMAEIATGHSGASPEHKAESPKDAPAAPSADAPNPNPSQHADIP